MFKYHLWALLLATVFDFIFGRLYSIPNPMDSIERVAAHLDRALLGDELILLEPEKQKRFGLYMLALVLVPVFIVVMFFTMLGYEIAPWVGILVEAVLSYFCLEGHRLFSEAIDTYRNIYGKQISGDEATLTEEAITKLANDASDMVLSPLFIMLLFGPVGGFLFRALDILDKQVGYKTYRYEYFGYYIAKLFTIVNYIPGRFAGTFTAFAAKVTFGDFHWKNSQYINLRDRTKALGAFAGALQIQLKEKSVGDADKIPAPKDIKTAALLLRNEFMLFQLFLLILVVI